MVEKTSIASIFKSAKKSFDDYEKSVQTKTEKQSEMLLKNWKSALGKK